MKSQYSSNTFSYQQSGNTAACLVWISLQFLRN